MAPHPLLPISEGSLYDGVWAFFLLRTTANMLRSYEAIIFLLYPDYLKSRYLYAFKIDGTLVFDFLGTYRIMFAELKDTTAAGAAPLP